MKKLTLLFLTAIAALLWLPTHAVHAAAPGFAVQNIQSANQIDKNASYYQLLATPNGTGSVSVKISNYTNGTHRYKVAINRATTNANGEVDYTQAKSKVPANSQPNIAQLFTKPKTVSIAPRSVKTVTMTYKLPAKPIVGIVLGGVNVTCLDADTSTTSGLSSQVAYVTAVQLQPGKTVPHFTPDLKLKNASVTAASNGVQVFANVINPLPVIQSKMTMTAKLIPQGKKKAVLKRTIDAARLAPNSIMPFALNMTPKDLAAGDYKVVVDAHLPNNAGHWHFTDTVHITQAVVKSTDTKQPTHKLTDLPLWVTALLIAIVAALILLVIWLRMRNNELSKK